jgi:hypothetical protein
MTSYRLNVPSGENDLEESIEDCRIASFDAEHGLANFVLTIRSPRTKERAADHLSTTLAIRVEERAAINLLLDLHELSNRMGWNLNRDRQTFVRTEPRVR